MKVADFITEFRGIVQDNEVPPFWASENIVRYLNEAVQEACERAKLIEDRTTPAVCSITLQAESTYALHPQCFRDQAAGLPREAAGRNQVRRLTAIARAGDPGCARSPQSFIFEQAMAPNHPGGWCHRR